MTDRATPPLAEDEFTSLKDALLAYEAAFEDLFAQCCSNPIRNAWGKQVDMTKLNHAHYLAGDALLCDAAGQPKPQEYTAKDMANRLMGWRLPEDFSPDGGVVFTKPGRPSR